MTIGVIERGEHLYLYDDVLLRVSNSVNDRGLIVIHSSLFPAVSEVGAPIPLIPRLGL